MLATALWSMGIAPVFLTFALWGMTTDVALAKEREVHYRYRNRYYKITTLRYVETKKMLLDWQRKWKLK